MADYFNQIHRQVQMSTGASVSLRTQADMNNFLTRVKADFATIAAYINTITYPILNLGTYGPKWSFDIMQDGIAGTTLQTFPEEHGGGSDAAECYWYDDGEGGGRPRTIKETFDCIMASMTQVAVEYIEAEQDLSEIESDIFCLQEDTQRIAKDAFGCTYSLQCNDDETFTFPLGKHLYEIFRQIISGNNLSNISYLDDACGTETYPDLSLDVYVSDLIYDECISISNICSCAGGWGGLLGRSLEDDLTEHYRFTGWSCPSTVPDYSEVTHPEGGQVSLCAPFNNMKEGDGEDYNIHDALAVVMHELCLKPDNAWSQIQLGAAGGAASGGPLYADQGDDTLLFQAGAGIQLVGTEPGSGSGTTEIVKIINTWPAIAWTNISVAANGGTASGGPLVADEAADSLIIQAGSGITLEATDPGGGAGTSEILKISATGGDCVTLQEAYDCDPDEGGTGYGGKIELSADDEVDYPPVWILPGEDYIEEGTGWWITRFNEDYLGDPDGRTPYETCPYHVPFFVITDEQVGGTGIESVGADDRFFSVQWREYDDVECPSPRPGRAAETEDLVWPTIHCWQSPLYFTALGINFCPETCDGEGVVWVKASDQEVGRADPNPTEWAVFFREPDNGTIHNLVKGQKRLDTGVSSWDGAYYTATMDDADVVFMSTPVLNTAPGGYILLRLYSNLITTDSLITIQAHLGELTDTGMPYVDGIFDPEDGAVRFSVSNIDTGNSFNSIIRTKIQIHNQSD